MDSEHEAMRRETIHEQEEEKLVDLKCENKVRKRKGLKPLSKIPFWRK